MVVATVMKTIDHSILSYKLFNHSTICPTIFMGTFPPVGSAPIYHLCISNVIYHPATVAGVLKFAI
jgi:hypothetical protein